MPHSHSNGSNGSLAQLLSHNPLVGDQSVVRIEIFVEFLEKRQSRDTKCKPKSKMGLSLPHILFDSQGLCGARTKD